MVIIFSSHDHKFDGEFMPERVKRHQIGVEMEVLEPDMVLGGGKGIKDQGFSPRVRTSIKSSNDKTKGRDDAD